MSFQDRGVFGAHCSNPAMSIIGAEDEDFENDLNDVVDDQCTTFNSIEQLKTRPTHLLVFLQHVILQFDCAPLLCYLHADLFRTLSTKETKKLFVEFYTNFLDKGAVSSKLQAAHFNRTRPDLLSEDLQKRYAHEVQFLQASEVAKQLEDFRQKRMMGMTPNEAELMDVESHYPTDRIPTEMKEKSVAENLLDKMAETQQTIVSDEEKCQSIFSAVAFYMKHLGVKTRAVDSKKSRGGFFSSVLYSVPPGAEKEKVNQERKSSGPASSRISQPDPAAPSFPSRKSVSGGGSASVPGSDASEGVGINISAANSPESLHSDGNSRSDPPPLLEGGEASPTGLGAGLSVGEPLSPNDTPTEENVEKERCLRVSLPGPGLCPASLHSVSSYILCQGL
uniref:Regulator of G protein signalling-like domain-containing protein n=1 Tax=Myripristis murdjan TaxID=586833 RepID=A0A668AFZ7_9TELE